MIIEELKLKLQELFPAPPDSQQEEAVQAEDGQDESEKKDERKRENGIIECDYTAKGYHLDIQIDPEQLRDAVTIIDESAFFLETITGVDWINENQMEVIYDFSRLDSNLCRVVIRAKIDRANPVIETISDIYPGANWHERETHDFFGIQFKGHPYLVPLLLAEDADYHPLLKDYKP